jgi:hypothetical protein
MKKSDSNIAKAARKEAKANIKTGIIKELKLMTSKMGQDSKKLSKEIEKGAEKLAKKIVKEIKVDKPSVSEPAPSKAEPSPPPAPASKKPKEKPTV